MEITRLLNLSTPARLAADAAETVASTLLGSSSPAARASSESTARTDVKSCSCNCQGDAMTSLAELLKPVLEGLIVIINNLLLRGSPGSAGGAVPDACSDPDAPDQTVQDSAADPDAIQQDASSTSAGTDNDIDSTSTTTDAGNNTAPATGSARLNDLFKRVNDSLDSLTGIIDTMSSALSSISAKTTRLLGKGKNLVSRLFAALKKLIPSNPAGPSAPQKSSVKIS